MRWFTRQKLITWLETAVRFEAVREPGVLGIASITTQGHTKARTSKLRIA